MVNENQSSDLEDPLHGLSGLSMFPRTFRDSTNFPKTDDIESIHNYMKSMALKSPVKLLEQAKVILGGGSELMNSKFASLEAYENKDEPVAAKARNNLQERRPALGLKRARFSMRPSSIQPSLVSEPILDIAKLKDPVEYFLACEKFENAKKELERLRGGVVADLSESSPAKTARRRRPGILGKKYSYKHHQYLSVLPQNDSAMVSSQEKSEQEIFNPDGYGSQPEPTGPNVESQENELAGSMAETGNGVSDLLDELLSSNCENLDEDGALSFLQERLQIKPIDLGKLCLPDLHDIGVKLSKARKPLSDIQNLVKATSSRTPAKRKQISESPLNPLASPTPPRCPLAAMSLLKKRISQSSLSSDPFSALDIDLLPPRDCSPVEPADEEEQVDSRNSSKSTIMEKDNITADSIGKPEVEVGDSVHQFDMSMKENTELGIGVDIGSSGAYDDLEFYNGSNNTNERLMNENVSGPTKEFDNRGNTPGEMGDHVEDMPQKAVPSAQPIDININDSSEPCTDFERYRPNETEENVQDTTQEAISYVLRDINIEDSTVQKLNSNPQQSDQSDHAGVKLHGMAVPSRKPDICSEQHIEQNQEPSNISLDARNAKNGRKRKVVSRRKSLAEAGTYWESGVRRSSRIKMRPLEYWKGERFLYGRIHDSLATVIGVKYVSPGKGGAEPSIRVKSYVSDKYKELVELAALH